jgi:hypothetical protein
VACKQLCCPEEDISCAQVDQWMMAFMSDPVKALAHVPHDVYRHLRKRNLLDVYGRPHYPVTI